jgi:hypothetical protein
VFDERGVWGGSGEEVGFERTVKAHLDDKSMFLAKIYKEVVAIGFVVF